MKGDFSRSTFDARKHYSGVRMQQGRVQLDADWNEQLDILSYHASTRMRDLLGPRAAPAIGAGFQLTLGQPSASDGASAARDLLISAGRYYVDGLLCENERATWFSQQPDYPGAALPAPDGADAAYLVYLDTWQRHITCIEDPELREAALGGADTATRSKTVWQIKLCPISRAQLPEDLTGDRIDLAALPEWQALLDRQAQRGQMEARHKHGPLPGNQLYRVEIHSVDAQGPTLKWSRENGSVVFPIHAIEVPQAGEAVSMPLAEPALVGPGGAAVAATPSLQSAPVAAAAQAESTQFTVTLDYIERDTLYLHKDDWVELEDDDTALNGASSLICQVVDLELVAGQGEDLGELRGQVVLVADSQQLQTWAARLDRAASAGKHPLLRRWDQREHAGAPLEHGLLRMRPDHWQTLEHGIELRFTPAGSYAPGDYWLLAARTALPDRTWPVRAPDGIEHHYSPLALLSARGDEWQLDQAQPPIFATAPELSAVVASEINELHQTIGLVHDLQAAIVGLQAELAELKRSTSAIKTRLSQRFRSDEVLEVGDVVVLAPELHEHVRRAHPASATLLLGVVRSKTESPDDAPEYTVVVYGRTRCKVLGAVNPGDLLVPAERAGCARRAGLYIRPGTLIGKALAAHQPDAAAAVGLVDVLVMLG